MRASDVIEHYDGSAQKAAQALGLKSRQTVYHWLRNGDRVPELRARQYHELTRGKLKFESSAYNGG